ncbi:hypothetical protein HW115_17180 [Verrucomicrobiaceae bacterium N1E253]|uniref:Uncharacterized protein n=1 Tax=Oceaniferula marina TaxID=2748318 RepID=A0A851GJ43_9BACT|nr:hypothetical protein [Oceaniferula marina]NWK57356.1 hypothetical protein [Oceaniferula marina]
MPQWSEEDRQLLEKGELVVGGVLLVEDPAAGASIRQETETSAEQGGAPVDLVESSGVLEVDVPEARVRLEPVPDQFLSSYFSAAPESYLIDPQRLFSNQETLDREGYLKYYADESEIDVRVYMFDAHQEIPAPYTLGRLVEGTFVDGPLTAVVFYYLGQPERSELLFGGEGAAEVSNEELCKILESAKIKALEKSDASTQMESFLIQLSISTYWMEQDILERTKQVAEARGALDESKGDTEEAGETEGTFELIQPYLWYGIMGLGGVALTLVSLLLIVRLWLRSRRYHFPVLDIPKRLGADYAAGVGSVIGFHNKTDSPSSQRDQIPDYLTRL